MNKQNTKQRLFEVMGKVNENFKSKLNENFIEQQPVAGLQPIIQPEIAEVKNSGVNPKYTHFAVLKRDNKIVNGWDYRGIDPEELKLEKLHYFFNDIKDMQIEPRIVKILTTKTLQKMNIDPFNFDYWNKDQTIFTL